MQRLDNQVKYAPNEWNKQEFAIAQLIALCAYRVKYIRWYKISRIPTNREIREIWNDREIQFTYSGDI